MKLWHSLCKLSRLFLTKERFALISVVLAAVNHTWLLIFVSVFTYIVSLIYIYKYKKIKILLAYASYAKSTAPELILLNFTLSLLFLIFDIIIRLTSRVTSLFLEIPDSPWPQSINKLVSSDVILGGHTNSIKSYYLFHLILFLSRCKTCDMFIDDKLTVPVIIVSHNEYNLVTRRRVFVHVDHCIELRDVGNWHFVVRIDDLDGDLETFILFFSLSSFACRLIFLKNCLGWYYGQIFYRQLRVSIAVFRFFYLIQVCSLCVWVFFFWR